MTGHYILNKSGEPVLVDDYLDWATWYEVSAEDCIVRQQMVGDWEVSTVFLGLDHNWSGKGPPVLWETMIFKSGKGDECGRCSGTREQAEAMHHEMVRYAESKQPVLK